MKQPHSQRIERLVAAAHSHRRLGDLEAFGIARELLEDAEAAAEAVVLIAAGLPQDLRRHLRKRALAIIAATAKPTPHRRKASAVARSLRGTLNAQPV